MKYNLFKHVNVSLVNPEMESISELTKELTKELTTMMTSNTFGQRLRIYCYDFCSYSSCDTKLYFRPIYTTTSVYF